MEHARSDGMSENGSVSSSTERNIGSSDAHQPAQQALVSPASYKPSFWSAWLGGATSSNVQQHDGQQEGGSSSSRNGNAIAGTSGMTVLSNGSAGSSSLSSTKADRRTTRRGKRRAKKSAVAMSSSWINHRSESGSDDDDDDKHDSGRSDSDSSEAAHESGDEGSHGGHAVDEESLMWEAQMALIAHDYGAAMRKLRRAARHGSFTACLSLANILVKGLACRNDQHSKTIKSAGANHQHHTVSVDPTQAAHYYIRGLELVALRDEQAQQSQHRRLRDVSEEEDDDHRTASDDGGIFDGLGDTDMETVQDLASGLCSLYRLGRLRARRPDESASFIPLNEPASRPALHSSSSGRPRPDRQNSHSQAFVESTESGATRGNSKGKGRASPPSRRHSYTEPTAHVYAGSRRSSTSAIAGLWERGGAAAEALVGRLEFLLGVELSHTSESGDFHSFGNGSVPLTMTPGSQNRVPSGSSIGKGDDSSGATTPTPTQSGSLTRPSIKKSPSFSKLPPRFKSLLDPLATRHGRSALIHLYYIAALVAFSASEDGHERARDYWNSIIYVSRVANGAGSKEADELVNKARVRLDMLADQANLQFAGKALHLDMPAANETLTVDQLLSPPVAASASSASHTASEFDFAAPATRPGHVEQKKVRSRLHGIRTPSNSRRKSSDLTPTGSIAPAAEGGPLGDSLAANEGQSRSDSGGTSGLAIPSSSSGSRPAAKTADESGTSFRRKPKFSIPDSPTSTIRSGTSRHRLGSRSRGNSDASVLSGVIGQGPNTAPAHLGAPWPLTRSPSSTSITVTAANGAQSQDKPAVSANTQLERLRSLSGLSASVTAAGSHHHAQHRLHLPHFKPALAGKRWKPVATYKHPSAIASDPVLSALDASDLRQNSTSVASLPHVSVSNASPSRPTKSFSMAHLFMSTPSEGGMRTHRALSSTSLASFSLGLQKSFSSLRSFFLPAESATYSSVSQSSAHVVLEEDSDDAGEDAKSRSSAADVRARQEEEMAVEEARQKALAERERIERQRKLEETLLKAAQRHDEAVAELHYWQTVDAETEGSEPNADSWNIPLPTFGDDQEESNVDSGASDELIPHRGRRYFPPPGEQETSPSESSPAPIYLTRSPSYDMFNLPQISPPKSKTLRPLSTSIPSSLLAQPSPPKSLSRNVEVEDAALLAPPTTPTTAKKRGDRRRTRNRRSFRDLQLGGHSSASSGTATPITPRADYGANAVNAAAANCKKKENGEIPGPLKIDPLLAALEAASRVNVKSRCAICGKTGVNFPKCQKCGMTFCSRECRTAREGDDGEPSHACV